MKITKITAYSVHTNQFRNFNFVRVDTDEGIHGVGELFCVGADKCVVDMVDYVSEWVLGQDPLNRERIQKGYSIIRGSLEAQSCTPWPVQLTWRCGILPARQQGCRSISC